MARTKQEKDGFVVNPNTGRYVKIGSATYKKLVKNGEIEAKTPKSPKPKKGKKGKKSPARSPTKNSPGKMKSPPKKKVKKVGSPKFIKTPPKQPKKPIEKEMMHKILDDLVWKDYFIEKTSELIVDMVLYYNDNNDNGDYIDDEMTVLREDGYEEILALLHSEMLEIFLDYVRRN